MRTHNGAAGILHVAFVGGSSFSSVPTKTTRATQENRLLLLLGELYI